MSRLRSIRPFPLVAMAAMALPVYYGMRNAPLMHWPCDTGGIRDCKGFQNDAEIQGLARFAVQEYNEKQNALLEYIQLVKAQEHLVAGTIYYLTLEADDRGVKKICEAKVLVQPWMKYTELVNFKLLADAPRSKLPWWCRHRPTSKKIQEE